MTTQSHFSELIQRFGSSIIDPAMVAERFDISLSEDDIEGLVRSLPDTYVLEELIKKDFLIIPVTKSE